MSDMGEGFIFRDEEGQGDYLVESVKRLFAKHGPIRIKFTKYRKTHSRSQENLFWQWMTTMDQKFYRRSKKTTQRQKEDIHDLICHKFLGYQEKIVGKTVIKGMRTLTWPDSLEKGEMARLMKQTERWAAENGCLLPVPEDNDYAQYRDAV
jgi:hypothetical protein